MPAKVSLSFGLAIVLLGPAGAQSDDAVRLNGSSDIAIRFYHNGDDFDAEGKRNWFDMFGIENDCGKPGTYVTKYEQWTSIWTSGMQVREETSRLQFTTYPIDEGGAKEPIYSITVVPDDVDESASMGTSYGSADVEDLNGYFAIRLGGDPYRNFDRATGRLLFVSDKPGSAETIGGENWCEWSRYLAYTTDYPRLAAASNAKGREFLASISYSSRNGIQQTVVIDAPDGWRYSRSIGKPRDWEPQPILSVKQASWVENVQGAVAGAETSAPDHLDPIIVSLQLDEGLVVEIPVREDRMVLQDAKLPEGFTVSDVN